MTSYEGASSPGLDQGTPVLDRTIAAISFHYPTRSVILCFAASSERTIAVIEVVCFFPQNFPLVYVPVFSCVSFLYIVINGDNAAINFVYSFIFLFNSFQ